MFAVNSTSVITESVERICRVMQRVRHEKLILSAGVFNCRRISGSSSWSQHAYGNAADLFTASAKSNRIIADSVVYQAKHKTIANRGKKLAVAEVIDHENRRRWTPSGGWGSYSGATGLHVHVSGAPFRSGTPACA